MIRPASEVFAESELPAGVYDRLKTLAQRGDFAGTRVILEELDELESVSGEFTEHCRQSLLHYDFAEILSSLGR